MHSLDTAIAQSCLQNTIRSASPQAVLRIDYANRNGSQWAFLREFIPLPRKVNRFNVGRIGLWRDKIRIKAVLTIESSGLTQANQDFNLGFDFHSKSSSIAGDEYQSTSEEDSIALQESEKIRRMRISKANRGNTPWNKGRKHSPETLQRIRERTRLAMQDPKVKMKLVNSGHAQSKETRIKIGVGVRMGWEKRRKKLLLQETCLSDWQNFIAKAAKGGLLGEEELQWDSYRILDKQLKQEWMQSVEQRKKVSKPKGSKRAPKSLEQRRKISEAISAKWSDPEYRDRVYSGLSKYHGIAEGIGRKPKRNPTSPGESRRRQPSKRKADCNDPATAKPKPKSLTKRVRPRSSIPEYKDPLVGSKLEMLKNIRAQRAAAERNKSEAVVRAKALIAEAETAVKVLEEAAKKSPIAQASLVEARKLIDEAIQSIASIEKGQVDSQSVGSSSVSTIELNTANISDEMNMELEEYNEIAPKNSMESSNNIINGYNKAVFENFLNENNDDQSSIFMTYNSSVNGKENGVPPLLLDDAAVNLSSFTGDNEQNGGLGHAKSSLFNGVHPSKEEEEERTQPKPATTTKKWVRGKLVEVTEGC